GPLPSPRYRRSRSRDRPRNRGNEVFSWRSSFKGFEDRAMPALRHEPARWFDPALRRTVPHLRQLHARPPALTRFRRGVTCNSMTEEQFDDMRRLMVAEIVSTTVMVGTRLGRYSLDRRIL